jgi:hypothetical protein
MKIKPGFKLNQVCGESFIMPMGESNIDFSKLIVLNESSLFLWQKMEGNDFTTDDLVNHLLEEYEVTEEVARRDVDTFIKQLQEEKILD